MAPVERTRWMASTWDFTRDHSGVHWASPLSLDCFGVHIFIVELLWTVLTSFCHLPPHPPNSLSCWAKIVAHLQPEMAKIKQETNSNLYYIIIFNRLQSPVLLNKVGLA